METKSRNRPKANTRIKEFLCKRVGSGRTILCIVLTAMLIPSVIMNIISTANYNRLLYEVNQRSAKYNASVFIQLDCSAVVQLTNDITGGWSNRSDWNEYWEDILKLYSWVDQNISYNPDPYSPILPDSLMRPQQACQIRWIPDLWQYPNETLDLRTGDCEDVAILLCSMILNYVEEKLPCETILIAGSQRAHTGMQIVLDQNITILDTAMNYYTSLSSGNLTSNDIDSEIKCWIDHCSLGNDTRVTRVFSNSLDKRFSTMSEYLSWMYARDQNIPL